MKIIEQLNKIIAQENINIDKDVVFSIAKASDGSLRDAEALLDQLISFSKDKVSISDVIAVLGIVQQEQLFNLTDRIIHKDSKAALGILNDIIDAGKDIGLFLNNLIEHFRNLMICKITKGDFSLIDLPQDICERISQQAQEFRLEEILSFFNILLNTQEMAKRFDSLRIPLEIGIIRLAHHKIKTGISEVPQSKDNKDTAIENPAANNIKKEEVDCHKTEQGANLSLDDIKIQWKNIVDKLSKIKISVATYLNEGEPIKLQVNNLTVSFPKNYSLHKEALERKENKSIVEKAASELLKTHIRFTFILSKDEVNKDRSEAPPIMKAILDTFNARTIKE
jgi:DNA polymerase-3 subunit gamma/tau